MQTKFILIPTVNKSNRRPILLVAFHECQNKKSQPDIVHNIITYSPNIIMITYFRNIIMIAYFCNPKLIKMLHLKIYKLLKNTIVNLLSSVKLMPTQGVHDLIQFKEYSVLLKRRNMLAFYPKLMQMEIKETKLTDKTILTHSYSHRLNLSFHHFLTNKLHRIGSIPLMKI